VIKEEKVSVCSIYMVWLIVCFRVEQLAYFIWSKKHYMCYRFYVLFWWVEQLT